jgi:hypothetical protein
MHLTPIAALQQGATHGVRDVQLHLQNQASDEMDGDRKFPFYF